MSSTTRRGSTHRAYAIALPDPVALTSATARAQAPAEAKDTVDHWGELGKCGFLARTDQATSLSADMKC